MQLDASTHHASFPLLVRDLERLLEFVAPESSNAATFSLRAYELLLRSATEFEALSKALLIHQGYLAKANKTAEKLTVRDYRTLDNSLSLSTAEVRALFWRPEPLLIKPFQAWATVSTLPWYKAYNTVKDNRDSSFHEASLMNVVAASSGLFTLLATSNVRHVAHWLQTDDERYTEFSSESFSVRFPRAA